MIRRQSVGVLFQTNKAHSSFYSSSSPSPPAFITTPCYQLQSSSSSSFFFFSLAFCASSPAFLPRCSLSYFLGLPKAAASIFCRSSPFLWDLLLLSFLKTGSES